MRSIGGVRRQVNGSGELERIIQAQLEAVRQQVAWQLMAWLDAAVSYLLGRTVYARRRQVAPGVEQAGCCMGYGSHQSRRFSRNGRRWRRLLTEMGEVVVGVPRVVCECGGSVGLDFRGWLRPYQRISEAVDAQLARWGALALSLRQMQTELAHTCIGPLGLRTLQSRLHQVVSAPPLDQGVPSIPPIVQVDAIWLTQLRPTGQQRRDAKGRLRPVKGRVKRPLLLVLGVWPEQAHCELLLWRLAEGETEGEWLAFLSQLEAAGVRGEQGLELLIHDGAAGLSTALQIVHFDAPTQRCLFHKLCNIRQAIHLPDTLTPRQRRQQRRTILKAFRAIWEAHHSATLLRRYRQVVREYRASQPQAVARLRRDFRATLTFRSLHARHPTWPRSFLRTTSHLERVNRRLRRHARAASAYHSDLGILAMVSQVTSALKTAA